MPRFYRSKRFISGLSLLSSVQCIIALTWLNKKPRKHDFTIKYKKHKRTLRAIVRGMHIKSDLQSVLELAAGDCYNLDAIRWNPDWVIDCGGNTGLFSLAAASYWPICNILCFEPLPENAALITRQLQNNGLLTRVKLIQAAVGDLSRSAKFFVREANQGSLGSATNFCRSIDVDVLRLWDIYSPIRSKTVLIKMDVEGAEFDILRDFFIQESIGQVAFLLEVHGDCMQQKMLLADARNAGFVGGYWEKASETAHLFLAGPEGEWQLQFERLIEKLLPD